MRYAAVFCLGLTALSLAGCYSDPFQNPTDWSPTAAAQESLAQQAANKNDLLQGRGDNLSQGVAASAALDTALGGVAGTAAGLQKPPKEITFSQAGS